MRPPLWFPLVVAIYLAVFIGVGLVVIWAVVEAMKP